MTVREKKRRRLRIAAAAAILLAAVLFSLWYGSRQADGDLTEYDLLSENQLSGMLRLNGIDLDRVEDSEAAYQSSDYLRMTVSAGGERVRPSLYRSPELQNGSYYLFYILSDYSSQQVEEELQARFEGEAAQVDSVIYGKNVAVIFYRAGVSEGDEISRAREENLSERMRTAVFLNALGGETREFRGSSGKWTLTLPLRWYEGTYRAAGVETRSVYAGGTVEFQYDGESPENAGVVELRVGDRFVFRRGGIPFVEIRQDVYVEQSGAFRIDRLLSEYEVEITLKDGSSRSFVLEEV